MTEFQTTVPDRNRGFAEDSKGIRISASSSGAVQLIRCEKRARWGEDYDSIFNLGQSLFQATLTRANFSGFILGWNWLVNRVKNWGE